MDDIPDKTSAPRASKVDNKYIKTDTDEEFAQALHAFRRETTLKTYGRAHLANLGYGAIMGDRILERIVDCARANKIRSLEALRSETKWSRSDELGEEVISIINRYVRLLSDQSIPTHAVERLNVHRHVV